MTTNDEPKGFLDVALKIGERLGVPILILGAVFLMAREAGMALYSGAVVPLVKAHGDFLDATQHTLKEIGDTQRQQATTMQEIVVGQREITAILEAREEVRN